MYFILVILAISYYLYYTFVVKRKHLPPGPTPLPMVGNMLQMDQENPNKTLAKWGREYGGVYSAWIPDPVVVITDYDVMKETILKQGDVYAGRPYDFVFSIFVGGKYGIVASEGKHWRDQRRFALHVLRDFGFGRNAMEGKVLDEAYRLVERIDSFPHTDEGVVLDPKELLSVCVGSIISCLVFGHPYEYEDQRFQELKGLLAKNFQLISHPAALMLKEYNWLRFVPLFGNFKYTELCEQEEVFRKFFMEEIDAHKKNFDENQEPRDYIEAFLKEMNRKEQTGEEMQSFTDWQLYATIGDLWIAGMETTVTTMLWGLLFLILNPGIQEKLHEEMDRVVGSETQLSMNDKNRLPYFSAVLNEVQRLANIVPINLFHTNTQESVISGYRIPSGTTIIPQISSVLHDPKIFPDPLKFDPERFLENDGTLKKVDALVPFSMGKRQCLGESLAKMELFLISATLMQKYKVSIPKGELKPSLDRVNGLTVAPKHFKICVQKRH